MRPSKLIQYIAFTLLSLWPLAVVFVFRGLPGWVYLAGPPAWWLLLGSVAALWHRNFEEDR